MRKYKIDDVQILLSTMGKEKPEKLIASNKITGNYIIVNQTNTAYREIKGPKKVIVGLQGRGLSKSRNHAICNANCAISVLSDDDVQYYGNYRETIAAAYNKYPKADMIVFMVDFDDRAKKKRVFKEGKIGRIKALGVSSVQITFLTDRLREKKVHFDERFGSGSKYNFGEENIFLYDCLNKKMKIMFVPKIIAHVRDDRESTWFRGYNEQYLAMRGAVYSRMSKTRCPFLAMQFLIRKRKLYNENMTILSALKLIYGGAKRFTEENKR